MILLLMFAFGAGFITIFSPCILSIAPLLLAASAQHNYYKPLGIITGLIISFSFFTLTMTAIVQATGISADSFRYIALAIIIFFGLTMLIPALGNTFAMFTGQIARLGTSIQEQSTTIKKEFFSGLALGIALGLVWTPCAGPILATVTAAAATQGITLTTILVILSYSIGAATPMLALCFGGKKIIDSTSALVPYSETIRKIFGTIIIISALAIAFHLDTIIQEKIAHLFPTMTFEQNSLLDRKLSMLKNDTYTAHPFNKEKAPALVGITAWVNSQPLTLEQLRSKVILLDFWTYTCINCIRTLPHVVEWYNRYKNFGLEIIGVHTPEFAFEKNRSHVEDAIKRFNISYPVALDNDYATWNAYNNHYWPAHYLIDQNGVIVKKQFGEGHYIEMENAIRSLLGLSDSNDKDAYKNSHVITPETYLGFDRGDRYASSINIKKNESATYNYEKPLDENHVGLNGLWLITHDCAQSLHNNNTLEIKFIARHVYLVTQSETLQPISVLLDGKAVPQKYYSKDMNDEGKILVEKPRMYELIDLKNNYGEHTLTLQCPAGISAYVFTFGD